MYRLIELRNTPRKQTSPTTRLTESASLVSILLFVTLILLQGDGMSYPESRLFRNELMHVQRRIIDHNIDKEGSLQKAWQILMSHAETPQLQLHPRTWPAVEMVNVVKHLSALTVDAVAELLQRFLLPEAYEHAGDFRYERLMLQVHRELDGCAPAS